MITVDTLRKLALSFPEVIEAPHFEKTSFRVNKKIFATYDNTNHQACIKLSEIDQDVFSSFDKSASLVVSILKAFFSGKSCQSNFNGFNSLSILILFLKYFE